MKTTNKNKSKAWRLIQKRDGLGQSREYCRKNGLISSLNSKKNYHSCIKLYLDWRDENGLTHSEQDKLSDLIIFMGELTEVYMQKRIDDYKAALSITFNKKLPYFKSEIVNSIKSRNYYLSEIMLIIENLQEKNAISILLCFFVGLRAHELGTLRRAGEIKKSRTRIWSSVRFLGIVDFRIYLVTGKGGLTREVAIPNQLAEIVENRRLDNPKIIYDRGIRYESYYDLGYGKALSECFSRASQKILNWTTGLHGLRHSYAQGRMFKLINLSVNYEIALKVVSEELGHFRPNITLCYLR